MQTDKIVVPSAAELNDTLTSSGRVALYGIHFDSGDAAVETDSNPTLAQIIKLLKSEPSLSLIGHTDNQGEFTAKVKLSGHRAAPVVVAAPNIDAAGRAKNRRMEFVRR